MKIFLLSFSLTSGGAEKFTVDLSNQLAKSNDVFLCVILSDHDPVNSFFKDNIHNNIRYINLGSSKGINVKTFFTIFNLIREIRPDVVHVQLNAILYLYIPAIIFFNKIKFIHTLHSLAPKTIGFKWQRFVNSFYYKNKLIQAVVISEECENSFYDFYGHRSAVLIENGVSKPIPTTDYKYVRHELELLKRNSSDKIFIHIGRFSEPKNQKLLINVFNRLIEENFGAILIVIGKDFDTSEGLELKSGSKAGIYYLGTKINISDYLICSDIFILSSIWEGLPISLLEAIACGVIPICTPAGGIPNVIQDESFGYLSKDFTEEGLYEAVIKCLVHVENFDGSTLVDLFNSRYSIEKCANEYLKIYS